MKETKARPEFREFPWLILLAALAHAPLLVIYFQRLWDREHYQFFPLLILAVGGMAWARWKEAPLSQEQQRTGLVIFLLALSWLLLLLGTLYAAATLAAVSALVALAALGLRFRARRRVVNWLGLWCLLWLCLRVPLNYDIRVMQALQTWSTQVSSSLLDTVGFMHLAEGNVLKSPEKVFFVDEACSGIMSLMTLLAAAACFAVHRNRTLLHGFLLVLSTVFWAGMMNVARICAIAIAHHKWQLDLGDGLPHQALSLLTFSLAFLGLLSTDQFLHFFLGQIDRSDLPSRFRGIWNALVSFGDPLRQGMPRPDAQGTVLSAGWRVAWAAALIIVLGLQIAVLASAHLESGPESAIRRIRDRLDPKAVLDRNTLIPANKEWTLADFKTEQRGHNSVWGEHSMVWAFHRPGMEVFFALDYPFLDWHELSNCYELRGWTRQKHRIVSDGEFEEWPAAESELRQPESLEHGFLLCSLFSRDGSPIAPSRSDQILLNLAESLHPRRLAKPFGGWTGQGHAESYQVQIWVTTSWELGQSERSEMAREFRNLREQIRRALAKRAYPHG